MLAAPIPLPNEIDRGYLGAVMRLNGIVKETEMVKHMAQFAGMGSASRREASCLELLSKIAQTDVPTFVGHHTTLPLRRGITSYHPGLMHGSEDSRSMLWTTGMRVARPGAYCCPECIRYDLATHFRSYWHREHQLPGLVWCPTHKAPLHYMESEHAFLEAPNQILEQCHVVAGTWLRNTIENRFVNTFLDISSALLERKQPFGVKHVSAVLKQEAVVRGFQAHPGKVKSPLLSDAVVAAFGREWLATVMPTLADKCKGEMLKQMDGVLFMATAASSVTAYILALSVLFENPEDALNALVGTDTTVAATRNRKSNRRIEDNELRSAYFKSHGSYSKTASLLLASYSAICGRLRDMRLPNLSTETWPEMQKAATAFFVERKPLAECITDGNLTFEDLENFVRAAGSAMVEGILEINKPTRGRGSGVRRPKKLTPNEVDSTNGSMAVKFSPNLRPEQRLMASTA